MSAEIDPDHPSIKRANDTAEQQQVGTDFFRLFYFPSDHPLNGGGGVSNVGSSLRSLGQPILQGAASAVMGGILSAVDTALAILNEDFDNPSGSMTSTMSSNAYDGDEDDDRLNNETSGIRAAGKSSVMMCCRNMSRTKLMDDSKKRDGGEISHDTKCDIDSSSISGEEDSEEILTSQFSILSSLRLLEETPDIVKLESGNVASSLGRDSHNLKPQSGHDSNVLPPSNIGNENDDVVCTPNGDEEKYKREDSAYCIIEREKETSDGWLVVRDE